MQSNGIRKRAGNLILTILMVLIAGVGQAWADGQEEGGTPSVADKSPYALEEIKVFANKREQSAQDTPIAMTVLDARDLEDAGIVDLDGILQRIPNLYTGSAVGNNRFMSFRGKNTMSFTESNPLIIYVDGIPMDSHFNVDPSLLNIERVEILRGAQSVMYGKSSMGGVVNIVSQKPDNESRYSAYGSLGSYWERAIGGLASGPLVEDKLFYAISGEYDGTNGYMDNVYSSESNSRNTGRVKGQLRYLPTDRFEMNLIAEFMDEYKGMEPNIKGDQATLESKLNPDDRTHSSTASAALSLNYDSDWSTFESVSTYRRSEVDYHQDMTYLDMSGLTDSGRDVLVTEVSQEFRLRSPDEEDGIRWLVGLYGDYKNHDRRKVYSVIPAMSYETHSPNEEKGKDFAGFGQLVFPMFNDRLELSTALRAQYSERDIEFSHYNKMGGTVIPGNQESGSDSWGAVLPRLGLNYHFSDDVMAYASLTRGFQPGGFNWSSTSSDPEKYTFSEETSWDYELGVKSTFWDSRLRLNANLFYSDIKDLQTFSYEPATMSYVADNAGKARSWGGELDLTARLVKGLDLEVSAAFTRATFTEYSGQNMYGQFDYSGNEVPLTPAHTLSTALQYRGESGLFIRGEVLNYGKLYWDDANTSSRSDITVANARIGYEANWWRAYLFGNNVFDTRYISYYATSGDMGTVAAPMQWGVRVEVDF